MPEIMIFKEVIDQNGVPFTAYISSEGQYVNGKWVPGITTEVGMSGVILPLVAGSKSVGQELNYIENGVYTTKEKKLLTTEIIEIGTKVKYKNDLFTLQAFTDYTDYTDVNIYIMRYREGVNPLD